MLTMRTRYALKALTLLAEANDGPLLIAEIAQREAIPRKFLEAILRELKQHRLLSAQRGRGGGYSLARRPSEITLAEIHRALEGPIAPLPCLSRTAYRPCGDCSSERECGLRLVLREMYEAQVRILESTTLLDLVHADLLGEASVREASDEGGLDV